MIANVTKDIKPFPVTNLLTPFPMDYFLYSGSVEVDNQQEATVQWMISRQTGSMSLEQLKFFQNLLDEKLRRIKRELPTVHELEERILYHISPYKAVSQTLSPISRKSEYAKIIQDELKKKREN